MAVEPCPIYFNKKKWRRRSCTARVARFDPAISNEGMPTCPAQTYTVSGRVARMNRALIDCLGVSWLCTDKKATSNIKDFMSSLGLSEFAFSRKVPKHNPICETVAGIRYSTILF